MQFRVSGQGEGEGEGEGDELYSPSGRQIQRNEYRKINNKLEFGMYPQSMPTEWTHARTLRRWQSVRLDL